MSHIAPNRLRSSDHKEMTRKARTTLATTSPKNLSRLHCAKYQTAHWLKPENGSNMNDAEIVQLFSPLYGDIKSYQVFEEKPLLAHYTTIQTLEKILLTKELWFSNPLLMNDFEEVRFGLSESERIIATDPAILDACGTGERRVEFFKAIAFYSQRYVNEHLNDTYIFCLSEHDPTNPDGLLSMWRGYGGNGNGAAIVFDTSQMTYRVGSPLIVDKVKYETAEIRREWITTTTAQFCKILKGISLPTDRLHLAAHALFERIKLFSLFSKHKGFEEECEWRVVYMRDRDLEKIFDYMFHYVVSEKGIQPKLRFKIEPIKDFSAPDLSLSKIIHSILLGPSISSPIAKATIMRMFDKCSEPALKDRVFSSTIPFRPI